MRVLLSALIWLLLATGTTAGDLRHRVEKQSRFYGVGWQADGSHWSIELLLTPLGGQIAYPSLACSGEWKMIRNGGDELEYVERITLGTDACVALGTVVLSPLSGGRLLYTWHEFPNTTDARAVLRPATGARLGYMELLRETLNTVDLEYVEPALR